MRVLVLTALLTVAAAAPSGELKDAAPLAVLPVVTPTIDPGDIQAAAINAQVAAEDQARAAADKIVEENNEKVIESDSLVKEKTEESFWATEDKKWQALDAVQTAAAKIDGAVASSADAIARSALGGVILPTYVAPNLLPAPLVRAPIVPGAPLPGYPLFSPPVIAPIAPIVYTPGLIAKNEENKELVKNAELIKSAELQKNQLAQFDVKNSELEKDKKVQFYTGIASVSVYNPFSPVVYVPLNITKTDKDKEGKTNENGNDKLVYTIYRTQPISPLTHFYYNPNIVKQEDLKETEKEIVKNTESDKDNHKVFLFPERIFTSHIISPVQFYSSDITAKHTNEKHLKDNEIENNAESKEENKFEEKKEEKPLETADKDKLEKPLAPLVPLVAPQPWPLSPVAPVYVPQQVLAHW